jgi:antitoxin (DNA-binding transcriptional repressor) of toxin-antitoxin stability system
VASPLPSWDTRLDKVATGSYHPLTMRAVGIKVLKNKLSEYVRLAEGGETILVTDRDRVVAELGPPREGRAPLLADAQLAEAVRHGWITPPALPPGAPPPRKPIMSFQDLLRELEQDREDR